jgi:hypothetical protein
MQFSCFTELVVPPRLSAPWLLALVSYELGSDCHRAPSSAWGPFGFDVIH